MKTKNRILILLVSIVLFTLPFLDGNKTFAATSGKGDFDEFLLFEDLEIVPLDPNTVIDLDKNPDYFEGDDVGKEFSPLASCGYYSISQTSKSGSKILLVGNTTNYGYCHIKERHMRVSGLPNFKTADGASQFYGAYTPLGMMDLSMQVIDGSTVLHHTDDPNRRYKELYIHNIERNYIRVVIHKGSAWGSGYDNYDWIIVTAYPDFKDQA